MKFISLFILLALLCQGCSTIHGRQETVEFSRRWVKLSKPLIYCGSDERCHHFTTRPVDSYIYFEIDRHELHLADERPYTGNNLKYYYAVDPARDFAKLDD